MLLVLATACGGDDQSSPATTRPSTTVAPTSSTRPVRSITIASTGDLLPHDAVIARAREYAGGQGYDFRPMLAPVKALVSGADFATCHLEIPLSPDDTRLAGFPVFNAPHELADAIDDAGYDACSTSSNHSLDQGEAGVKATLDALDQAGVGHAGTARTPDERDAAPLHDVNGVRLAFLSYTYGINGTARVPAGKPWLVNLVDAERIKADARATRARGAELVVVNLHAGDEYVREPSRQQREVAADLLADPAIDVVIGQHVHVVQPIERVGTKYAVYGLGNSLSNQDSRCCSPETQDGMLVRLSVDDRDGTLAVRAVTFTPTWVEIGPYRVLPVASAYDDPATSPAVAEQLARSWRRTNEAVLSRGAGDAGVRPDPVPTRSL